MGVRGRRAVSPLRRVELSKSRFSFQAPSLLLPPQPSATLFRTLLLDRLPLRSIALLVMAKYTKFGSPDAEESAPKASTSKLAPASQPPPPSSSSIPPPSPSFKKRPRSSSLTNGSTNGNGQTRHNHTVSYHQSDEEDELASKHQRQQQPLSKKKRRREGSLTNGASGAGGDTAAEKDKRRAVAEKLRKERMELPIWAGEF